MRLFALTVTLFDTNQLSNIQKEFVYNLLPKVGINRYMPRTVVYGPVALGGMGIMDLCIEQPVTVIKTMLGHIQRDDKAGKVIMANLIETQVEVGISRPFYTEDIHQYTYITKNTRWHYIWRICHEMEIKLQIENMWAPLPTAENDHNLMEDALKDTYFHKRLKWKLEVINNCQQYIGAYYINNIMDTNGHIYKKIP